MENQVNNQNNGQYQNAGGAPVMDEKIEGLLCYLFSWVGGLVFLLVEKNSKLTKFHAIQSLILGASYCVLLFVLNFLGHISIIFSLLSGLLGLAYFVLWIVLMIKAYHLEKFKLPVIGDIAEQQANK